MKKIKVGIIGCGTIGSEIAKACAGRLKGSVVLGGLCDIDERKAKALNAEVCREDIVMKMGALIDGSDLVVEAAAASSSADVTAECIRRGRDCMVMSTGGLLGRTELFEEAAKKGVRIYIPSGAVCGIDGLKSAMAGKVDSVTITTKKPPRGLAGAPYIKEKGIDVNSFKSETVIFDGSAEEAVRGFPANVNVAAVLSLAGIGAKRTRVRIMVSPGSDKNIHEIEIAGESGRINTVTENVPSGANPKTSALAIYSAIATLEGIVSSVRIGT
jgi:aspartate dehydrogenase